MRMLLVTLAVLALAGCGARQSTDGAATPTASGQAPSAAANAGTPATEGASGAVVASAPRLIEELTNQKLVYECPSCGMDFDAAGQCTMDGAELVATKVDYTCPKDGRAVEGAGKCPRCPMNARVEKTAMAAAQTSGGR